MQAFGYVGSVLLVGFLASLVGNAPASAVSKDGYYFIYSPAEVDCSQTYNALHLVELSQGRESAFVFCSKLAQGNLVRLQELQADEFRLNFPWSVPYNVGDYVCRDRASGYEVVCLFPEAAQDASWWFTETP